MFCFIYFLYRSSASMWGRYFKMWVELIHGEDKDLVLLLWNMSRAVWTHVGFVLFFGLFLWPDLAQIDPDIYLTPFLDVIKSEDTTGPITGVALSSVHKFLSYGTIGTLYGLIVAMPRGLHTISNNRNCWKMSPFPGKYLPPFCSKSVSFVSLL